MIHISAITEHIGKNLPLFPNGHKSVAADSTHFIAEKLMEAVKWFLGLFEQQNNSTLTNAIYAVLVCVIALLLGSFVKWILLVVIHKVAARYKNDISSYLTDRRFFTKISRIIPPIVFLIFLQFTFVDKDTLAMILAKLCWI